MKKESEKYLLEIRDMLIRMRTLEEWPEIIKAIEIYGNARVRESKPLQSSSSSQTSPTRSEP